jgi:cytochrome c oxidase subunit III
MGATTMPASPAARPADRSTTASVGVWVAIATISMSFAAYTSALVVRQGASGDWLHFRLPSILWLNSVLILASSVTLERARRNHSRGGRAAEHGVVALPGPVSRTTTWIDATLALGVLFLAGQLVAWRELAAQGLFLATNPSSAFFYILTALHGLHLLGGFAGLLYVRHRLRRGPALAAGPALGAGALYWHFMAVLWLYLLALLVVRL